MKKGKGERAAVDAEAKAEATGTPDVSATVAPLPDPMSFVGLLRDYAGKCAAEAAKTTDFRARRVWMSRNAALDWLASTLAQ